MRAVLHEYQNYSKNWIIDHPAAGLLLDMGLGKTLTTLMAINELKYDYLEIDSVLVIAPLKVAQKTWSDEVKKWSQLSHLRVSKVIGPEKKRLEALNAKADIYLINVEQVVWLVEHFGRKWPFKMVVIDELSAFKNPQAKRFKALRQVRPLIRRVVGLTGTPAPNSLIDLWPQMYLLDRGERLEKHVTKYRNKYFTAGQHNGYTVYSWTLRPGAENSIFEKISDLCISMKAKDFLRLPPRTDNIIEVSMSAEETNKYKVLEKELVLTLPEGEIVAVNAAVLSNKLLQLAGGAIYDEDKNVQHIHDRKLEALEDIIEESQGEPILIFYYFKHDLERLKSRFKDLRTLESDETIDEWNSRKIPLLAVHPKSAGHGLNLQKGGHIAVWFSLTWSLEYYQQANARLARQGQESAVIVHHLVAKNTLDERVIKVLQGKENGQNALLEAVKAKIKEVKNE
ncbi:ATP-dependent helicase [Listeria monocytogenes]|uniref:DEAD/DEAH box helicase n=1 Tax=Listeria monocytogenes TaxID=1639 RepID=A0A9P1SUL9_LISMN|nr:DEAD/DEAH box helicase [Listeria monocytogenes]EAC2302626.1 DEAD/DEAH box helicase [Listeria monocytogenes]EAC5550239.1 DEAD/DEAH box helicase [Listeria monocytogenes]EAC9283072.1 DEAD/DEAH box helicase [Listeria monocytogenes]EAC9294463.1 DEAD/DEAH box helicase [Listeria monocytogenes]